MKWDTERVYARMQLRPFRAEKQSRSRTPGLRNQPLELSRYDGPYSPLQAP